METNELFNLSNQTARMEGDHLHNHVVLHTPLDLQIQRSVSQGFAAIPPHLPIGKQVYPKYLNI